MRQWGKVLETFACKCVMLLGCAVFVAFTYWALKYKHEYPMDLSTERVVGYLDNKLQNIIVLVLFLGVMMLIKYFVLRGDEKTVHRRVRWIAILTTLVMCVLLAVWVSICHITPIWDQLQVYYGALEFHAGKYDLMDSYYNTYPQQYGLSFIYELLLWLGPGYRLFQYINVILIGIIIYFVYLLTDELFHNEEANFYAIIGVAIFTPLPLYVNFVYGELWNMSLGLVSIWAMLRYLSTKNIRYGVLSVLMMSVAMVARINIVVWAIALMLVLLVYGFSHREGTTLMLAILILAIPILSVQAVKVSYELRSGKEILPGAPYIMTISMGLQEQWEGPGYYSGYTNGIFNGVANRDKDVATEIAMEDIKVRMREFMDNPAYARDFFQRKIWQQWNEGTYNSLIMTCTFEQAPEGIVQSVYYGKGEKVIYKWCNWYLFVIYFFVMAYAIVSVVRKREIEQSILIVALIGGLIFSIVWETKARYMFPYTVLMFPCMAAGMCYIENGVNAISRRILPKVRRFCQ